MVALSNRADHYIFALWFLLVHGQVTIIFIVSVGLSVCLFVCAEFFSAIFDLISIKLGHMLCSSPSHKPGARRLLDY